MIRSVIQRIILAGAISVGLCLSTQVSADDAEQEPIATVNGVMVPKSRFNLLLMSQTSQGQQDTPAFREELRDIMITREVLVQEAQRRKMEDSYEYRAQLDAMRHQLLISMLFNELIKEMEPTEDAKKAEYDRIKAENDKQGVKEYRVRHILVETEDLAREIIAKLKAGGDFAALAKEHSGDTGTKENGGELDWATPDRYVKPFGDAMVALKKGELSSEPVQSNFGYHVIEALDERAQPFPAYDTIKDELRKDMLTRTRDDLITKLRGEAKIEKVGELDTKK